ncbi:MAG TPA: hypothetical protein VMX17_03590 [Candidatus Glassbacteria bacterium]|nr:hypothetical protein [Candidatus Glassbacteria bacterium]
MPKKKDVLEDNGIDGLKELVNSETELENLHHKHRMMEIDEEFLKKKELACIKFDQELELQKVKSEGIKQTMERKMRGSLDDKH